MTQWARTGLVSEVAWALVILSRVVCHLAARVASRLQSRGASRNPELNQSPRRDGRGGQSGLEELTQKSALELSRLGSW